MLALLVVFLIATAVGYKVISDVPSLLHTPLMSGMNALSGVTVVGAVVVAALAVEFSSAALGACAIVMATVNIVAGFRVTHRMLSMFKDKTPEDGR